MHDSQWWTSRKNTTLPIFWQKRRGKVNIKGRETGIKGTGRSLSIGSWYGWQVPRPNLVPRVPPFFEGKALGTRLTLSPSLLPSCPGKNNLFTYFCGYLWWPTTVTVKPKTSRQKQKHHGKTKNLTAKTKYLTAKPKTSRQLKQNTSRQNQILHSKNKIALVLPWVFAFAVRYLVFAVKYLILPWGLWFCSDVFGFTVRFLFLPWGFRFCREVFCFRREVFGFAVTVVGHRCTP